jgi:hypothetical protein
VRLKRFTTRRIMIAVAGLAIVLGALTEGKRLVLEPPSSALRANEFSQIGPGMTLRQVSDILGGPPGDYGRYAGGIEETRDGSVAQVFSVTTPRPVNVENWQDDRNHFFIFFDDEGSVVAASRSNQTRRYPRSWWLQELRQLCRYIDF